MKKSLSLILAIAMAFSMFANVAFAADTTTTAKTTEQKYAELEKLKIFEGDETGANLEGLMDRAQLAKIVAKLKNLPEDKASNIYTDVPADHWAAGFVGAVTKAKIFDGVAEGKFDPSSKVTLEQLAKVLVVTAGLNQSNDAVTGKVADWAKGYVAAAVKAFGLSATDYTVNATRGVFVELTFAALDAINKNVIGDVDAKAVGAKKMEVTFKNAVDTAKAGFKVTRSNSTTDLKPAVTWNDAKTVATLTFNAKFTTADYNVEVSGVVDPVFKKTISLKDEKVEEIKFPSDTVSLKRTPVGTANDNKAVETTYKVLNQYGEEINNTSVNFTASKGTVTASNGHLELTVAGSTYQSFNLNESVMISAYYNDYTTNSNAQAQKTFTVGTVARVSSVELVGISNYQKTEPAVGKTASDYRIEVKAVDQYGNKVTDVTALKEDVRIYVSNPSIFTLTTTNNVNEFTKEDGKIYVTLSGSQEASTAVATFTNPGKNTVTAYAVYGSKNSTLDVEVLSGNRVANFTFGAPDVAVAGEINNIPFTATDKDGKELNTAADYKTLKDIVLTSSTGKDKLYFEADHVNNKTVLKLDARGETVSKQFPQHVNMTATVNQGKVDTKFVNASLSLKENARPVAITGLKDTKMALLNGGATTTIEHDKVLIVDQYDREYKLDDPRLVNYNVVVSQESGDTVTVAPTTITATDKKLTLTSKTADERGSNSIKLALKEVNGSTINGSDKTFTIRVVKADDLTDIAIDDVAKLYAYNDTSVPTFVGEKSKYSKELKVSGLLSDGTKVGVKTDDNRVYVTSSVYGLDYAGGKLTANYTVLNAPSAALNGTTNEAKVNLNIYNAITKKFVEKEVVVSKTAPAATSFAVVSVDKKAKKAGDGVVNVLAGQYTNEFALANAVVEVKDQYGVVVDVPTKFAKVTLNALTDASGNAVNTTSNADVIAKATVGSNFQVLVSGANGASYSFKVVVVGSL